MRLHAYLKSIEEAAALPASLSELTSYFNDTYSPKELAFNYIAYKARRDTDRITNGELITILETIRGIK
jgi:hypothetical protein